MLSKNALPISFFRILYQGVKIIYKSVHKSILEEVELSREAARIRYQETSNESPTVAGDISLSEAMQILNIRELDASQIEENFKFLFESNEKSNGGSFYLQSKIVRAKQRVDAEIKKQLDAPLVRKLS
ncbi:hypothetical protein Zmor_001302 [Zophobas morio]|uniref:Mitochondrial import inner membrane translocase subunit TIM16 n=1 Tax=Zophobas morio TaxID=2755281 RepID=A0AA38IYZ3_9CUCU|nr:hypothetical protein Zmor_001302 [Zophobas morio]